MKAKRWLKSAAEEASNDCNVTEEELAGKSTQYDFMRYLWDMATDENIPVEKLADIYVDMCPTNWEYWPSYTTDPTDEHGDILYENAAPIVAPTDDWPEARLERSVRYHGKRAAHNRQKSNGVDYR